MTAIHLTDSRYGKAEVHLLRVTRRADVHEIRDLTVSVALAGDHEHVYRDGDNTGVLPTDSQKNTVHAFAAEAQPGQEIEDLGLRLARHFVATSPAVHRAEVRIDEHAWTRIGAHPHAFTQGGPERRQAMLVAGEAGAWAAAGLEDLLVLKSAGSEFRGFARDRYTTLEEAGDRILATTVTARWRYTRLDVDWTSSFAGARRLLLETFAAQPSRSLQHTLHAMGAAVLEAHPEVAEIRLRLPNRHHFAVDVAQFGTHAEADVYHIADRPYGVIEGTLRREDAPDGPALDW